jgi:hypothetical protein
MNSIARIVLSVFISFQLIVSPAYAGTCDNVKGNPNVPEQKIQYCVAAEDAESSKKNQDILAIVWGIVTVICTVSCANFTQTMQSVCDYSNWIATGTDLVLTMQNDSFMSAGMQSVGMTLLGSYASAYLSGQTLSAFGSKTFSFAGGKDAKFADNENAHSCTTAAFAGLHLGLKVYQSGQSNKSAKANEELAKQYDSKQASVSTQVNIANAPDLGGAGSPPSSSTFGVTGQGGSNGSGSSAGGACGSQIQQGDTGGILECAAALDSNLPKGIKDKSFADEFKKLAGMDLGDFVKKTVESGISPTQATAALATGNKQTDELASKLEAEYAKLDMSAFSDKSGGSTYAGSGGSAGGRGQAANANMNSLFGGRATASVTGNFAQEGKSEKFGRTYDEIFNDRKLSLFKRVESKYSEIKPRVRQMPFSSQYNLISIQNK